MMRSKARGQAEEIPARRRWRVAGGGGREAAAGAEEPRYFDRLSEDLTGTSCPSWTYATEKVCHTRGQSVRWRCFMPLWIASRIGWEGRRGR